MAVSSSAVGAANLSPGLTFRRTRSVGKKILSLSPSAYSICTQDYASRCCCRLLSSDLSVISGIHAASCTELSLLIMGCRALATV